MRRLAGLGIGGTGLLAFLAAAGCAGIQVQKLPPAGTISSPAWPAIPAPEAEGSLFLPQRPLNYFADVKARNAGDILTVQIVESASASKNATTKTARKSDLEASWSGVLGKWAGSWVGAEQKAGFGNEFDGKGETTRTSHLSALITAHVIQVFPNGNLLIRGSRRVRVNHETQFMHIQGVIRPEDIAANNVVLSTAVAEAQIELVGEGVVSDKQRTGWLTRILDWVWPF